MDRIVEIAQSFVRSGRFCIEVSRDLEADCLMRPFLVVVVDEVIEARLLLQEVI